METLRKSDFYYDLPEELIAQTPAEPRDSSRLLVYHRDTHAIEHKIFRDVIDYLRAGDVLVVNRTRVLPARIYAHTEHGGAVEVLLLKRRALDEWEVLVRPGRKCRPGTHLVVNEELALDVLSVTDSGERIVRFAYEGAFEDILSRAGTMPLPPYIHEKLSDPERYQTVYSRENGSAAAPTRGCILRRSFWNASAPRAWRSQKCCCTSGWGPSVPSRKRTCSITRCTPSTMK